MLFAGQIAVFSSFETDDLQIEEYPSWQTKKVMKDYLFIFLKITYLFQQMNLELLPFLFWIFSVLD